MRTRNINNRIEVWDELRRKWILLTAEERVRQNLIEFLVRQRAVSQQRIVREMPLNVSGLVRRADIVVLTTDYQPLMVVECKAKEVKITQEVIDQVMQYNLVLNCRYIAVTNSTEFFCCDMSQDKDSSNRFLSKLPPLG